VTVRFAIDVGTPASIAKSPVVVPLMRARESANDQGACAAVRYVRPGHLPARARSDGRGARRVHPS
jgi:hypothetical protein